MNTNKNKFMCESVRLCRFLYGLGFDKESIQQDNREKWLFDRSPELQESLDFYFLMRKKLRDKQERMNNEENKICVQSVRKAVRIL